MSLLTRPEPSVESDPAWADAEPAVTTTPPATSTAAAAATMRTGPVVRCLPLRGTGTSWPPRRGTADVLREPVPRSRVWFVLVISSESGDGFEGERRRSASRWRGTVGRTPAGGIEPEKRWWERALAGPSSATDGIFLLRIVESGPTWGRAPLRRASGDCQEPASFSAGQGPWGRDSDGFLSAARSARRVSPAASTRDRDADRCGLREHHGGSRRTRRGAACSRSAWPSSGTRPIRRRGG